MVRMNPELSIFQVQSVPTVKSVCCVVMLGFFVMRIQIVALAVAFSVCEYELFIGSCSP